ncbi:oxalurate catabolism protein HpxZ [Alloalcanivorax sp. C16-1]|uniref:oxalurate catabolism protein HpxZ n=1 Tax=Alloalcanivorax sp. C16-1 TaxID=3390051 RepID=UPI0039704B55
MSMELDLPEVVAEVHAAFEEYENALVNNDVAVLDRLFWEDSRVVRYGAGENLYGYDQIQAFRAARPGNNLARTLHNTRITTHGRDLATVWTEFTRPGNSRTGRQSQVWARRPEGWRVVAAHVSFMDEG